MRLEQWGVGKEHHRMASECPEYVIAIGVPIIKTSVVNEDGLSQIYQYRNEIIEKKFSQQNKVLGNIEKFA